MADDSRGELLVKASGRPLRLPIADIDCLTVTGKYVVVHVGDVRHHVRAVLDSFESRLPADRFARVHREAIVNLERMAAIRPVGEADFMILMRNAQEIRLGRRYRSRLPELFGRVRSGSA